MAGHRHDTHVLQDGRTVCSQCGKTLDQIAKKHADRMMRDHLKLRIVHGNTVVVDDLHDGVLTQEAIDRMKAWFEETGFNNVLKVQYQQHPFVPEDDED